MAIMTEATDVLRNGATAVRSTIQRRQKALKRSSRFSPEKLMKQVTQRFEKPKARRVPVVPIVIASGAALAGIVAGIVVLRRMLEAELATEEFVEVNPEKEAYEHVLAEN
jgi:ribosomal protein L18E